MCLAARSTSTFSDSCNIHSLKDNDSPKDTWQPGPEFI